MAQDSLDMFNLHEAESEAWLMSRPVCAECGEPIQEESCYRIDEGVLMCECCIDACRVSTDNFIRD